MIRFLEALAQGLGNGSVYALLALGFVVVYKATRVISLAQPSLMLLGGLLVSVFAVSLRLGFFPAVGLAAAAVAAVALAIERLALRPLVGRPASTAVIVTLGVDIIVRVVAGRFIGMQGRQVGDPWGFSTVVVGGVAVQRRFAYSALITALIVAGMLVFFRRSRLGLALRATASDQEAALAQGVCVGTMFALSWAIAGALAAVAGALVGIGSPITPVTWVIALRALPAIVLGGLESLGGAVIGGLAVGTVEALVAVYQPQFAPWLGRSFAAVSPYLLMLLVLRLRPYGLFGAPEVDRV